MYDKITLTVCVALSVLFTYLILLFSPPLREGLIDNPLKAIARINYQHHHVKKLRHSSVYWTAYETPPPKGVTIHDPARAFEGFTIMASSHEQKAYLVDMAGNLIHEWKMPYSKVWDNFDHVEMAVPEYLHLLNRLYLYPESGDLLAIYTGVGSSPLGYGMAKIDKDSNLVWKISEPVHHDAAVGEDGKIYTFTHIIRKSPYPGMPAVKAPMYEDFLLVISPKGEILKRISFYDAFRTSAQERVLQQLRNEPGSDTPKGDTLHPNTITLITPAMAGKAPMLVAGHLLISFRNNSMLAVLDPESERITWASFGPWRFQHDPKFLPDGSIVMFDNEGHLDEGGRSRVLNVDLNDLSVIWSFSGTKENPLYSAYHGFIDLLPNGNVLVTETLGGRIFEVTRNKEIVWEYRNPHHERNEEGNVVVPGLYRGKRYRTEDLRFLLPD